MPLEDDDHFYVEARLKLVKALPLGADLQGFAEDDHVGEVDRHNSEHLK